MIPASCIGPQIVGEKIRELLKGKYEIIPKTTAHIKVNPKKCIGMTCQLCYIICSTGSYEMVNGKAMWKFGMEAASECGACNYVCPVGPSNGLTRKLEPVSSLVVLINQGTIKRTLQSPFLIMYFRCSSSGTQL